MKTLKTTVFPQPHLWLNWVGACWHPGYRKSMTFSPGQSMGLCCWVSYSVNWSSDRNFSAKLGLLKPISHLFPLSTLYFTLSGVGAHKTWFVSARSVLAGAHNLLPLLRGINPQRQTRDTQKSHPKCINRVKMVGKQLFCSSISHQFLS